MRGLVHPFTGALYEEDGAGNIRVTSASGDRSGIFGSDGHWISGDLRECDPQLCNWVGGAQVGSRRAPADQA
jgi:hypothetical protein